MRAGYSSQDVIFGDLGSIFFEDDVSLCIHGTVHKIFSLIFRSLLKLRCRILAEEFLDSIISFLHLTSVLGPSRFSYVISKGEDDTQGLSDKECICIFSFILHGDGCTLWRGRKAKTVATTNASRMTLFMRLFKYALEIIGGS